jgi:hypothetical protein
MMDYDWVRQKEREHLLNIFKGNIPGFYRNQEGFYSANLYRELVNSLISYHDDACLSWKRVGNTLADNICKFTLMYNPGPKSEEDAIFNARLVNGRPLIGEGGDGNNYSHPFNGSNVITKVSREFTPTLLNEAFVNMVIINEYLLEHPNAPFVPTYGFFLCPERQNQAGEIEICKNGDRLNHLYFSQKQLEDVISFRQYIQTATMENTIRLFVKIIEAMIDLHNFKKYRLIHGDLHYENILVKRDGSAFWIIDWGRATFTCNKIRYTNRDEDSFTRCKSKYSVRCSKDSYEVGGLSPITGGTYDVYILLATMIRELHPIRLEWAENMLNSIFKFKRDIHHFIDYDFVNWVPWIYTILTEFPEERVYNHAKLQKYSYHYILQKMYLISKYKSLQFPDDTSYSTLRDCITNTSVYGNVCDVSDDHGVALWFCVDESSYFCDMCNTNLHRSRDARYHQRMNLEPQDQIDDKLRKKNRDMFASDHGFVNFFYNPYRNLYYEKGVRKRRTKKKNK